MEIIPVFNRTHIKVNQNKHIIHVINNGYMARMSLTYSPLKFKNRLCYSLFWSNPNVILGVNLLISDLWINCYKEKMSLI